MSDSDEWFQKGCEECRQGILVGSTEQPERLIHIEGGTFLHQCSKCNSYWEVSIREGHVISAIRAKGLVKKYEKKDER